MPQGLQILSAPTCSELPQRRESRPTTTDGMTAPIPPETLRLGMGPFEDPTLFLESGRDTLALAQRMIGLDGTHRVLDLGCGCGRLAIPMTTFLSTGRYAGLDIDAACIHWCVENIQAGDPRFSFVTLDVHSSAYNPGGRSSAETVTLPYEAQAFDRVIVSSVFTHMTERGIARYLSELQRVIGEHGLVLASLFLMDDAAQLAIRRRTTSLNFHARLGDNSWTLRRTAPLEGVALGPRWFHETAQDRGLVVKEVEYGSWRARRGSDIQHDWVVLARAREAHPSGSWSA